MDSRATTRRINNYSERKPQKKHFQTASAVPKRGGNNAQNRSRKVSKISIETSRPWDWLLKTRLLLCISSGLQRELTLQQPLGCLPNQLWEPCACLILSWYLCRTMLKSGLLLSPPKPIFVRTSFGELPMRSCGTATGQRTCLSPAMHLSLTSHKSHWCSPKVTPGVCQDQDGEKELGIWPVITVTIKGSSAAVILFEKDGNHFLLLLFDLDKYDNCFFIFYFINYISYWV